MTIQSSLMNILDVLDDPENYPILIHCKAGLHRTGLLTAIYRMKMQGWSKAEAVRELKANGFGNFAATRDNVYLERLILNYDPNGPKPTTSAGKEGQ